ncbi:hypothetical protein I5P86_05215 [Pseudomonas glycinae]|uniref:hypothetical protein n=1 Tax=Pseudomonas glycinae TaxID=1785145 RepID=UPI0018D975F0|nr:hypothetical protein [Pseudomonas glycinae]MBH3404446.1 hypothetical protein [Pseudomonas glycinae]
MAGAPKTNAADIIDRINAIGRDVAEKDELNIFAWNGIVRDLKKLESVPGLGETALLHQAVMWGMKLDRSKVKSLFAESAARFGKTQSWYIIRSNYATLFGDASMVVDLIDFGIGNRGANFVVKAIDVLVSSGFYMAAWGFLLDLRKLDAKSAELIDARYPFLGFASDYISRSGLSDLEVSRRVLLSAKVVVDAGFRLRKFSISAGSYGVSVELSVAADLDRLVDLNFAISDAIASSFESLISEYVTTGVVPWEAGGDYAS